MESINEKDCEIILQTGKFNYKIISFTLSPFSDNTIGFLGQHYRLIISANECDRDVKKILQFFVKTPPLKINTHIKYVLEIGVFAREILLLKNIIPKLQCYDLEKWCPKCFFAEDKAVVLEDLTRKNYKIIPVRDYFDYEHIECLMKTLARFHSSSIIYKEKSIETDIDKYFSDVLTEPSYIFDQSHARNKWLHSSIHCTLTLLKLLPDYKNNFESQIHTALDKMETLLRTSKQYYRVVSHGDLWSNNIMFKYNTNGRIKKCVLVDFQLARYNCPAYDVLSSIYLTTNSLFRKKYLKNLLSVYHETATKELLKYNIDIDKVLSWEDFITTCNIYKHAALIDAVFFGQLIFLDSKTTKSVLECPKEFYEYTYLNKRSVYAQKAFLEDDVYRERLTDILKDFITILTSK